MSIIFLILGLVASTFAAGLTDADLQDPELLKTINNYWGCQTWENGVCVACSEHYYFNAKGVCCEVKPECRDFNRDAGICVGCYEGYHIVDGQCVVKDFNAPEYLGCKNWVDGECT